MRFVFTCQDVHLLAPLFSSTAVVSWHDTRTFSSESYFFSRSGITDTYFASLFMLFSQFIRSHVKVWLSGLRVTLFKFHLGSKGSGNQAAVLVGCLNFRKYTQFAQTVNNLAK